jgi:Na+-transporting methylmalonyl-CoA/oxaloacetate decarboxylase gamma subunit
MPLLVYGIGFLICYFLIGFNWWMSLLIALAFPAALEIVMFVIGMPLVGIMVGIGTVIDKIKQRRRQRHPESTWENVSEPIEPQESEVPVVATAEIAKERKKKSNTFGTGSLVLGIVSLIFWPEVTGTAAIVLGVLQFRRHANKRAIAGFTLGVVGVVLAVVFHLLDLLAYSLRASVTPVVDAFGHSDIGDWRGH